MPCLCILRATTTTQHLGRRRATRKTTWSTSIAHGRSRRSGDRLLRPRPRELGRLGTRNTTKTHRRAHQCGPTSG
eukprot:11168768-Lingulodinium_polyedra.AAC.1